MKRLIMGLGTVGLFGLAIWGAQAAPLAPRLTGAENFSPLVQVGCSRYSANDRCPYGARIIQGPGGRWWCEPCGGRHYGRGWGGGYYGGGYPRGYYGGGYPRRHYYY